MQALTDVDEKILEVLKGNGGWMTRADLKDQIGAMNRYYVDRLNGLIESGLVEVRTTTRGIVQRVYNYRAV